MIPPSPRTLFLLITLAFKTLCAASPNVLLILTDDQGYGDLSLHGNPQLKTPNLDRLGKESVRLDRFYVSSVCAPTRASLLTGRYHPRTGATGVTRRQEVLNPAEVTLAELLRDGGYATGCFGKWHNGHVFPETPNGQGFDEFLGILGGLAPRYFAPTLNHNGTEEEHKGYITEILTENAMTWMDNQIEAGRPFFCYLPYNAPHTPGLVEERYWKPHYNKNVGRWEAVIYGMIEVIDEQIGRMLEFLENKNQSENTIVIFLSDNGPATWRYNAGLRGKKGHLYDGGTRVPCFIRWPGTLRPRRVDHPMAHIDLLPTLAVWCDLDPRPELKWDGRSFAKELQQPAPAWPDRHLISFSQGSEERIRTTAAIHTHRWSAVSNRGIWHLFDMQADVRQRDNLAKQHPRIVAEMRTYFEKTLATLPTLEPYAAYLLHSENRHAVALAGHDAQLPPSYKGKGIDYNYPAGFSHHWITSWTNPAAVPEWPVQVIDPGRYDISLRYCIARADLGVTAQFEIQGNHLPFRITKAFDPPSHHQPFILDGEATKYASKEWKTLPLGTVSLKAGKTQARIRVTELPGREAMEVKEVLLRRVDP